MKFYDRKEELVLLRKTGRAAVVGRRRIGKTRLLEEAMAGNFVYLFFYSDASESFIAEKWCASINKKGFYIPPLAKISDILEYIFQNIDLPLVIDEIQNCVKKFPEFLSLLQRLTDEFKGKQLFITGSLISLMKKVVEDYRSPVFGRFDFIIKLKELDVQTVLEIMSDLGYSSEDALLYYSVFGGIPKYYELIETLKPDDFNEFVNLMFFKYPRPLYNEIYVMLKEEIGKDFSNYFGIMYAAAEKGNTFGAISSSMNMAATSASKYLNTLMQDYELIRREMPITGKKKKNHYFLNSNIIDFWFRYCFSQREELDRGDEQVVYERFLKNFPSFYGFKFEAVIISLLPGLLKERGIEYSSIGKDWGKDYEFDFVIDAGDTVYIGEIKKGELNVGPELDKIEAVTSREAFYKNKSLKHILIADRFCNKVERENIYYISIKEIGIDSSRSM
ncbi:MAG: ATP-binding protein [bacterium]|nr:ATP-binding protein [bacterium]